VIVLKPLLNDEISISQLISYIQLQIVLISQNNAYNTDNLFKKNS